MITRPLFRAATAIGIVCLAGCGGSGSQGGQGPLRDDSGSITRSGATVLPGQWMDSTIYTGKLRGPRPAVIESVTPTDASERHVLRLRYAVLAPGQGSPGAARGWPPAGYRLLPLHGYMVKPGDTGQIVVGIASDKLGKQRIDRFSVRYHVGGSQYTATFNQGIYADVIPTCSYCR